MKLLPFFLSVACLPSVFATPTAQDIPNYLTITRDGMETSGQAAVGVLRTNLSSGVESRHAGHLPSVLSERELVILLTGARSIASPAQNNLIEKPRRETADCGRGEERAVGENYGVIASTTNPESFTRRDSVSFALAQESNSSAVNPNAYAQTVSDQSPAPVSKPAQSPVALCNQKLEIAEVYARMLEEEYVKWYEPKCLPMNCL